MTKGQRKMTNYKLISFEPTPEMIEAAEEAHMPFGDMDLAIRMAILAAPVVQGEPVETINAVISLVEDAAAAHLNSEFRSCLSKIRKLLYAAPQPAEQQPDVTLLLELLSHARCNTCDGSGGLYDNHGHPHQCQWCHDRSTALAAYRKTDIKKGLRFGS